MEQPISGIYTLTFDNGDYYIGKSVDILKRWGQHASDLEAGKHSKKMQAAYNSCGMPITRILMRVHEHHIDILESYFINSRWGDPKLLNTMRPAPVPEGIGDIDSDYWLESTYQHIGRIMELGSEVESLDEYIEELKSGTVIPELENQISKLKESLVEYTSEVHRLKNRGLLARIFNW